MRRFDFVNWDDPTYLTENANVHEGLTWSNVRWALTTTHSPYWHPLTWLSHMLDVTLYGMGPGPHHVTNALVGYVAYVWMTIWPTRLAAFYPFRTYPVWKVALAAAALVAVTILASGRETPARRSGTSPRQCSSTPASPKRRRCRSIPRMNLP